ncbi:MAG: bifunctional adenosylcobinamide kinase/adenosylcobinamide-phosphate guanylyltransferase [Nitrospiraceae bacterium]|nr:MAG: bifunctional adenosylcobinamide kinase/adenosylcobinamide-phosphate guanylyltransferase [Nitrospiraceae bacterium]
MKITFVIGGARSGKSSFVLNMASNLEGTMAYIATGEALDEEMRDRISKHREDRGPEWSTYEEPVEIAEVLSEIKDSYSAVVVDCLTLWLSNVLHRTQDTKVRRKRSEYRTQTTEDYIQEFIDKLKSLKDSSPVTRHSLQLFIVSNELGMGIVPENAMAREFRDLTGFLNQKVAAAADEVYLVTAGIPLKIKGSI